MCLGRQVLRIDLQAHPISLFSTRSYESTISHTFVLTFGVPEIGWQDSVGQLPAHDGLVMPYHITLDVLNAVRRGCSVVAEWWFSPCSGKQRRQAQRW